VAVALSLTRAAPGERMALSLLERATRASDDVVHHAAVAHVIRCGDPSPGDPPPPLGSQLERVDVLRQLLFSEPDGLWPQALEVIWESTRRVLEWESVRDIKAAQRIRPDQRSPLASSYAAAARLLGLSATPLLQLPGPGEYTVSVMVLGEPSVLVRGEPGSDGAQLRYDLGAALAGTLPPYAIINAATYEQIGDLFRAVHSAFGPTGVSQTNFNATARLAALLWESVPRRTQRLMTEWCKDGKLTRELAVTSARRAARRGGLFACGDLVEALARVVAEERIDQSLVSGPDGLARLCSKSPAAADLVRLALDPLYAHLRWRPEVTRPGAGLTRRGL
jgi:cellulose synthase operon protein C